MCQSIHSGVGNELLRHRLGQFRIYDRNIRCDLEIGDRVFDPLLIIGNDGERRNFRCGSGCRRDSTEFRLGAELRKSEDLAHIFECCLRIFILDPHGLRRIDRGTSADSHDPVRTKVLHKFRAAHNGLY